MANEISVNVSVAISSAGQTVQGTGSFLTSLGAIGFMGNEQTIGTAAEALLIGDVTTPAVVYIKNVDDTNFVEVDAVNTMDSFPQKIGAGQSLVLLPQTGTIWLKADTESVKIWAVLG